jgi:heme oxygenase (biliverdin-producing, ferredoxin)
MSLKELTHEQHRRAESRPFVKVLFSGNVNPKLYATYLKNQHPMYEILEVCAMPHGLFVGLPEIRRAPAILSDFTELWGIDNQETPKMCPIVNEYIKYILSIKDDPKKLLAHIYVRHMGDLSGGQMIAKRIPGSGRYYQFGDNPDAIKELIRSKLDDGLADEAKVCFDYAARFFEEMMDIVPDYE